MRSAAPIVGNNTLAGSIGNAGTGVTVLAKNDAGTWLLTGTNSYTGLTNINAGTLILGNGGTTGSIASAMVNNLGILGFNRSDTLTYGGVITQTGSVQQLGTGTTMLTGINSYTGGTTISAGTLQLGNGGTTGSIIGNVTDNGVLAFNRSDIVTFNGVISGTGSVRQDRRRHYDPDRHQQLCRRDGDRCRDAADLERCQSGRRRRCAQLQ